MSNCRGENRSPVKNTNTSPHWRKARDLRASAKRRIVDLSGGSDHDRHPLHRRRPNRLRESIPIGRNAGAAVRARRRSRNARFRPHGGLPFQQRAWSQAILQSHLAPGPFQAENHLRYRRNRRNVNLKSPDKSPTRPLILRVPVKTAEAPAASIRVSPVRVDAVRFGPRLGSAG